MRIFLAGATGAIGRRLVPLLVEGGHSVVGTTRDPAKARNSVVHTGVKSAGWENSRIMKGDLSKIVAKLKREKGGNIIVEGGPRLVQEFMRQKLADDYWFIVQPVVWGQGPQYWGPMKEQLTLKLLSSKVLEDGELLLHYETVRKALTKQVLLGE